MALTIPIIGFTMLMGALLNNDENVTERKNVSIRNTVTKNDVPNGSNIYTSDYVNTAELEVLKKASDNYKLSENPAITNVLPPLFNTYSINGNTNLLADKTILSDVDKNKINELNRRSNILEVKQETSVTSRPMFNPIISNDDETPVSFSNFSVDASNINPLTGLEYEKNHSNQVPFFGGSVKQNIEKLTNTSKLDLYTGKKDTYIHKKELEPFYQVEKQDINGSPMFTLNVGMDRFIPSNFKQGEKPFAEQRVYAVKAGTIENNIREQPKTVDELRVASKPKVSYEGRSNSGQYMSVRGVQAPVNKNLVDTYYENSPERWIVTPGAVINSSMRENYATNLKQTNRQDVSDRSYYGPGHSGFTKEYQKLSKANENASDFNSIVQEPMRQTLKIDSTRNFNTIQRKDDTYDYGKSSYTPYSTERHITGETNQFNLNIHKQNMGNKLILQDKAKTTIKETTSINTNKGHIKTTFDKGSTDAYNQGIQNWDAKSTHKEMHVNNKYIGIADKNEGMGYSIANYEAKTTGKESVTANSNYIGNNGNGVIKTSMSRFNYNQAEIDDRKEIAISNKRPSGPNKFQIAGGVDSQGTIKYTDRMMLKEDLNHRNAQDVNEFINPHLPKSISQTSQIGSFEYRKQEKESDRLAPFILNQLKDNPFVINGPNRI
jgi:hypothetical protein